MFILIPIAIGALALHEYNKRKAVLTPATEPLPAGGTYPIPDSGYITEAEPPPKQTVSTRLDAIPKPVDSSGNTSAKAELEAAAKAGGYPEGMSENEAEAYAKQAGTSLPNYMQELPTPNLAGVIPENMGSTKLTVQQMEAAANLRNGVNADGTPLLTVQQKEEQAAAWAAYTKAVGG